MADEDLRALERAASGGDVDAEARLLQERVRAGELTEERLRLAAWLGREAACSASGESPVPTDGLGPELVRKWWVQDPQDQLFQLRYALGILTSVSREIEANELGQQALFATEDYIACPCRGHAQEAESSGLRAYAQAPDLQAAFGEDPRFRLAADRPWLDEAWSLRRLEREEDYQVDTPGERGPRAAAFTALAASYIGDVGASIDARQALDCVSHHVRMAVFRRTRFPAGTIIAGGIRSELLAWALGYSDPVKERVEARKREAPE